MSWSIEKQMIYEKFTWYKIKGYKFDVIVKVLEEDKEIDNYLLEEVFYEALRNK